MNNDNPNGWQGPNAGEYFPKFAALLGWTPDPRTPRTGKEIDGYVDADGEKFQPDFWRDLNQCQMVAESLGLKGYRLGLNFWGRRDAVLYYPDKSAPYVYVTLYEACCKAVDHMEEGG